jgi:hypothetical protein
MNQLRPVDRNTDGKQAGEITLVDVATGKPFPVARAGSISWTSAARGWRGIMMEAHRHEPQEMPAHYLDAHGLMICASPGPIIFSWKENGRSIKPLSFPVPPRVSVSPSPANWRRKARE